MIRRSCDLPVRLNTDTERVLRKVTMPVNASHGSVAASAEPATGGRLPAISSVAAAWVLSVGFDVFLHGGVLARVYVEPSPFLLPPEEAFRRIPLGYLTFLGLTLALVWLLRRLDIRGSLAGFRFGATAGAVVWGALTLGLFSISTGTLPLLAGWWIGQTVELGLAGAVLGAAANRVPLKRIWVIVAVSVVALVVVTIALQSLGLAPAMKLVR
jgi:hypothetical protein